MMTSLVLLVSEPSDRASKVFWELTTNGIGRLWIGLKAIKSLNKKINHISTSQANNLSQLRCKPITNLGNLFLDPW
jgi:hypothetical protein